MFRSAFAPSMLLGFAAATALAQPAIDENLGVLPANALVTRTIATPGAQVRWYRFELAQPVKLSDLTYLNADTLNSVVLDTEIGLYDATGNLIATDDDDAAGSRSALSFGAGDNTFPGAVADFPFISNGRDGSLPAGVYYIAVAAFNAAFGPTDWNVIVTPISTATNDLTINLRLGTASVFASPAGTIDLGVLQSNQSVTNNAGALSSTRRVQWYKVTLPEALNAQNSFVDIDTEGSSLIPSNSTRLVMYTAAGAFTNLTDLNDGSNNLSQLTFGLTNPVRPAPGNGLDYNGRDGALPAGTYFIGVAATGTGPSQTNASGQSLGFASTSANFGSLRLKISAGAPSIPPGATATTLIANEGRTGLLRVTTTQGRNPAAAIASVIINTTNIGGEPNQPMFDDGSNGDEFAGDGVYTRTTLVNVAWSPNNVINLPYVVTDTLNRTTAAQHAVIVTPSVTGGCCAGSTCSVTREFLCTSTGGSFAGVNTDCGGSATYTIGTGTPFSPIAGTGTPITFFNTLTGSTPNFDDGVARITLPFAFNFYGQSYTQLVAVTNGFVQFEGSLTNWDNVNLPNAGVPNNAIYPLWDDLLLTGAGQAYTLTQGSSPNRVFIISWENVGQFDAQPSGNFATGSNNFQIVFREGSDAFELRYGDIDAITNEIPPEDFVTVGAENGDGSLAMVVNSLATVGAGNTSLLFTPSTTTSPCAEVCDDIDFNNNDVFPEDQDVIDFFNVLAGAECLACNDIDFNNNGVFPEDADVIDFFNVLAGGSCP